MCGRGADVRRSGDHGDSRRSGGEGRDGQHGRHGSFGLQRHRRIISGGLTCESSRHEATFCNHVFPRTAVFIQNLIEKSCERSNEGL